MQPKTFEYGQLFETFVVNEIQRCLAYTEQQCKLSFLRVSDTHEIDLIVERGEEIFLYGIKSADRADERMAKTLQLFEKDFRPPKLRLISNDPTPQQFGKVLAIPWRQALEELGGSRS